MRLAIILACGIVLVATSGCACAAVRLGGGDFKIERLLLKGKQRADDIPQRCIDHTVTEVTCGSVIENDALMPHPDDCQLFYYCLSPGHAPVCRQCPAGLHFSPTEHVCDEPRHAGCTSESNFNYT